MHINNNPEPQQPPFSPYTRSGKEQPMNPYPCDQTPMMPPRDGLGRSSRPSRTRSPITLYYGFVSIFFGFFTLGAFATGAPVMGFSWGLLLITLLLVPKLVRRIGSELVNRAPRSGITTPQYSSTAQQYGSIPQRPNWSTGMRYDPGVHGYQPGMVPGDTMRPTAAQNAARNMYGNGS